MAYKKFSNILITFCLLVFSLNSYSDEYTVTSIGPGAGTAVIAAAFDPTNANIMYAGGDCQGVMRSLDGGQTWSAPNTGLINPGDPFYEAYFVIEIEVDPVNSNNVYAGTMRGIYKSTDKAANWSRLEISTAISNSDLGNHLPISAIEVDPTNNSIVYAGLGDSYFHDETTARGVLLKSSDGGSSWTQIGAASIPSNAIIYGLALDPNGDATNRRLVASTDKGIFISEDGGKTFNRFESGLPHNKGRRVVVSSPAAGVSTFYLILFPNNSLDGGIYKWQVGEQQWSDANGEPDDEPLVTNDGGSCLYNWVDVHPTNPDTVYVASSASYVEDLQCETESFFRTQDGGLTWQEIVQNMSSAWFLEVPIFPMLALAPSSPSTLFGGYVGMSLSSDSGVSWQQVYAETQGSTPNRSFKANSSDIGSQMWSLSLAIDPRPEKANTMYQGYADTLLFKTDDMTYFRRLAATTVTDPIGDFADGWGNGGDANLSPQVTLDPDNPDIVYASANFRLYKSLDGGENWSEITGWADPYGGDLSTSGSDLSRRDNAARFALDLNSSASSRTLYVSVYAGGLYKSTDGGSSWTDLSPKLGAASKAVSGVYLDPSNSNRIYLGSLSLLHYSRQSTDQSYPIYYSDDGGDSWQVRGNLPPTNRIWIDPQNGQRLLAASMDLQPSNNQGGLYLSNDGGQNWQRVLNQPVVTDIILDPHVADRMWALSTAYYQYEAGIDTPNMSAGLYKSLDRGMSWQRENIAFNHYSLYPLLAHPSRANELYIGSAGLGVKKVLLSGDNTTTIPSTPTTPTTTPSTSIKANGNSSSLTISEGENIALSISLDSGNALGKDADWWFAVNHATEWKYLQLNSLSLISVGNSPNLLAPTYQGALLNLSDFNVLNLANLAPGEHTVYFAIDTEMNGVLDFEQLYFDSISIEIEE